MSFLTGSLLLLHVMEIGDYFAGLSLRTEWIFLVGITSSHHAARPLISELRLIMCEAFKEDGMMNKISATDFGYASAEPE